MVKWRSLLALGLGLLVSISVPAKGVGQERTGPANPPTPFTLEVPPAKESHSPTPPAHESDTHVKLEMLWRFITFRQPQRPRECRECIQGPSSRCTPPLYEYFRNRYPTPD